MITEQDLQAAIAECEGERNPNANTCIKLAAFYTIRDQMFPRVTETPASYSYSYEREIYSSDTEFGQIVKDMDSSVILGIMDEMMSTLKVLNPKLYNAVIRVLQNTH